MADPGNGALNGGDAAAAAVAELERRQALARERNRRFRERRRAPAPADPSPGFAGAGAPPVHTTRPLDELGSDPAEFLGEAPAVEHVADVEPADPEGAKKFAALVALVFRVALDDATSRYDLGHFAADVGAELDADELVAAKAATVRFVFEHAERCAIKHGFGLTLPYEDELVTLAAGAGGVLYLIAKFTGRLDRATRSARPAVRSSATNGRADPPFTGAAGDDEPDAGFTPLRVERAS